MNLSSLHIDRMTRLATNFEKPFIIATQTNDLFNLSIGINHQIEININYQEFTRYILCQMNRILEIWIEHLRKFISYYVSIIYVQNFNMIYWDIPFQYNNVVNSNHSNSPPIKEKSIKEIAIENFHYNMDRYKNSKIVSLIKCKGRSFAIELFKSVLLYQILKLLGMQ